MVMDASSTAHLRRAFSLVELLVVISIIAILLALALPSLAQSWYNARRTASLANIHQIGVQFQTYQSTYHGWFPFQVAGANLLVTPSDDPNKTWLSSTSHWQLDTYLHALMHDVASWRESYRVWLSPGAKRDPLSPWLDPEGEPKPPSYKYVHGLFARPQVWAEKPPTNVQFLAPVRDDEPSFPSQKCVIFDAETPYELDDGNARLKPMLLADGHGSVVDLMDVATPGVNSLTGMSQPLYDTVNGAYGYDVRP
jgi:prepilin-type N-terminal cleavage/methylation domain-containing protein